MADKTGDEVTLAKRSVNTVYGLASGGSLATVREVLNLMLEAARNDDVTDYLTLETQTLGLISSRIFPVSGHPPDLT